MGNATLSPACRSPDLGAHTPPCSVTGRGTASTLCHGPLPAPLQPGPGWGKPAGPVLLSWLCSPRPQCCLPFWTQDRGLYLPTDVKNSMQCSLLLDGVACPSPPLAPTVCREPTVFFRAKLLSGRWVEVPLVPPGAWSRPWLHPRFPPWV